MQFGLFSNSRRPKRALSDSWDRDIAEIAVADKLGFSEADTQKVVYDNPRRVFKLK